MTQNHVSQSWRRRREGAVPNDTVGGDGGATESENVTYNGEERKEEKGHGERTDGQEQPRFLAEKIG